MRINPKSGKDNVLDFGKQRIKLEEEPQLDYIKLKDGKNSSVVLMAYVLVRNDFGQLKKGKTIDSKDASLQIRNKILFWGKKGKPYYRLKGKRVYIDHVNIPLFEKRYKKFKKK